MKLFLYIKSPYNISSYKWSMLVCVFSPSGKLVQIEYALAAVAAGAPSVGIKGE